MRMTKFFGRTYREDPSEISHIGLQKLIRAGYVRPLGLSAYALLPLGVRNMQKIQNLISNAYEQLGAQPIHLPNLIPNELWKETQRLSYFSTSTPAANDNNSRFNAMSPLLEEVIHWLVRRESPSTKQLPLLLYWFSPTWYEELSDDLITNFGYENNTFHLFNFVDSFGALEEQSASNHSTLIDIFQKCNIPIKVASSHCLHLPQAKTKDYYYPNSKVGKIFCYCSICGYQSLRTTAIFKKEPLEVADALPLEKVATPNASTIQALAEFLNLPKSKTAKAVFFMARIPPHNQETLIFTVIRGDMELSEDKLMAAIGAYSLRPASEEEISSIMAQPGYASPIGIKKGDEHPCLVIVDDLIPKSPNLVAGANEFGYHYLNVNYGRDFQADLITDIALVQSGELCAQCGNKLEEEYGIPIARELHIGEQISTALGVFKQDSQGQKQPLFASRLHINLYSLMGCIAEHHQDPNGFVMPKQVAPFQIYLIVLPDKNSTQPLETAEQLYSKLLSQGFEVLFDDRDERPGVKFNDADLLGIPLRLTVSQRALSEGGIEWKPRDQSEKKLVPLEDLLPTLESFFSGT